MDWEDYDPPNWRNVILQTMPSKERHYIISWEAINDLKEFINPWMKKCNPDLILRLWRYKGSPGRLTLEIQGIEIIYFNSIFGEISLKKNRSFKN